MIGQIEDAVDFETPVRAGHALHFDFMSYIRRSRILVDIQVDDLRADVSGQLELIATRGQATTQVAARGGLLRTACCALAAVLCHGHAGRQQDGRCKYQ